MEETLDSLEERLRVKTMECKIIKTKIDLIKVTEKLHEYKESKLTLAIYCLDEIIKNL